MSSATIWVDSEETVWVRDEAGMRRIGPLASIRAEDLPAEATLDLAREHDHTLLRMAASSWNSGRKWLAREVCLNLRRRLDLMPYRRYRWPYGCLEMVVEILRQTEPENEPQTVPVTHHN